MLHACCLFYCSCSGIVHNSSYWCRKMKREKCRTCCLLSRTSKSKNKSIWVSSSRILWWHFVPSYTNDKNKHYGWFINSVENDIHTSLWFANWNGKIVYVININSCITHTQMLGLLASLRGLTLSLKKRFFLHWENQKRFEIFFRITIFKMKD